MGLRDTVQKAAVAALTAVGDLAPQSSYLSIQSEAEYDTVSGSTFMVAKQLDNIPMVFTDFSVKEVDGVSILSTDQKVLIAALDISVIPKVGDVVVKSSTEHWKVVNPNTDPAEALWVLHVRQTAVHDYMVTGGNVY